MKELVCDYVGIIEKELRQFAIRNSLDFSGITADEKDENTAFLNCGSFDVHFYMGEFLPYGYAFLEDSEQPDGYCFLTRFKFSFSKTYYSPYDVHNALELADFRTLDFHKISDEEDIKKAAAAVVSFIENNLSAIGDISNSLVLQKKLNDNYKKDMALVSKKITEEKLDEDFEKYTVKHEVNLNCHNQGTDTMIGFAASGKKKYIQTFLSKKSKKGKLLVFEKRLYEYLEKTGYAPLSAETKSEVKKANKQNRTKTVITVISFIIAGILTIAFYAFIDSVRESAFPEGIYRIIGSDGGSELTFILTVLGFEFLINTLIEKIFLKRTHSSATAKKADRTSNIVLSVIAAVVIAVCGLYNYYFQIFTVAVSDSGIYAGTQFKNETVPFDSERIDFFLIEGYYGYDEEGNEVYLDSTEDKDIYIVVDGEYEKYIPDSAVTAEELSQLIELLREKGTELISIKDYTTFEDTYIYT